MVQHGHEQIIELAKRRTDLFKEFINPNLLIDLFTNTMHSNKKDMIILLGEILDILKLPKESSGQQQNDEDITIEYVASEKNNENLGTRNKGKDGAFRDMIETKGVNTEISQQGFIILEKKNSNKD